VAGYIENDVNSLLNSAPNIAVYWKNGVMTQLTDGSFGALTYSITGSGSDVYIAGEEDEGNNRIAVYWKNGTADPVSSNDGTGSPEASARSIFLSGTDVYVCGFESTKEPNAIIFPTYWKNGISVQLSKPYAAYPDTFFGGGIFVTN
jgi:hypothetical protein